MAIDLLVSTGASLGVVILAVVLGISAAANPRFAAIWIGAGALCSLLGFIITRTYRSVIRYTTLREFARIALAVAIKEAVLLCIVLIPLTSILNPITVISLVAIDATMTLALLVLIRVLMIILYDIINRRGAKPPRKRVLIYGTNDKSAALSLRLEHSNHFNVTGFIDDESEGAVSGRMVHRRRIYSFNTVEDLDAIVRKLHLDGVIFATLRQAKTQRDRLIDFARREKIRLWVAPDIDEISDNGALMKGIRDIHIEDLLGREEIEINLEEVKGTFSGKCVLVTGAAGSIGSELCRQLARLGAGHIIMLDNAESPLHELRLEFDDHFPDVRISPIIGDVRSRERLDFVFRNYNPRIVFHAAAYKHVPLMEENPCEAVRVNVTGTRNVADKCLEYDVEKMVMVSTDKAVNPTNIMGCTKRLAEIYTQALGLAVQRGEIPGKTVFVTTRFGNVLGSNGSVIPRFKAQIEAGGPVTVTHPEIYRYFMTIPEACRLVMEAATMAVETRIFVFDMGKAVKIASLAERMIHLAGLELGRDIEIVYTGLRPGEKLYEEVLQTRENTEPTTHGRIFKATVRGYDYSDALEAVDKLDDLACKVEIPGMVKLMKRTVPEFISQHSPYEIYDKKKDSKQSQS